MKTLELEWRYSAFQLEQIANVFLKINASRYGTLGLIGLNHPHGLAGDDGVPTGHGQPLPVQVQQLVKLAKVLAYVTTCLLGLQVGQQLFPGQ